jgi:hypothetical protein
LFVRGQKCTISKQKNHDYSLEQEFERSRKKTHIYEEQICRARNKPCLIKEQMCKQNGTKIRPHNKSGQYIWGTKKVCRINHDYIHKGQKT